MCVAAQPTTSDAAAFRSTQKSRPAGNGTAIARWAFTNLVPGTAYQVSTTWHENANRASDAPYSIFDDTTLLTPTPIQVDQRLAPADFDQDNAGWKILHSSITVTSGTLIVQPTNAAPAAGSSPTPSGSIR